MKAIPEDVIADPDDPRLSINQPQPEQTDQADQTEVAAAPQPLQGIQPDQADEEEQFPPAEELATQPAPEGVPVRLRWFGRTLGEYGHAANYGPDGTHLQDHHVAISPDVAHRLGLNLHDWVWVGPQLRQYGDVSYHAAGIPNSGIVEVRDQKVDGHTTLRKATPDEVASFAPNATGQPLSAMQAAAFTGQDPSQITAGAVNQAIQGMPQRALVAGEPTAASMEAAGATGDSTGTATTDEGGGGLTEADLAADENLGTAGLLDGATTGYMPTPSTRGLQKEGVDPDGTIHYEGNVTANPRTGVMTWQIGPKTFVKNGANSHPTAFVNQKPMKDAFGNTYMLNLTTGQTTPVHPAGMIPELKASPTPDMTQQQRWDLALGDLNPDQKQMVWNIANYKAPVTASALRNPALQAVVSRASVVNPNFNSGNYDAIKRMLVGYGQQRQGTEGGAIRSFNTSIAHLDTLNDMAQAMHNTWNPKINSVKNWLQTQGGKPYQKAYDEAAYIVATEMARAFKGSAPDQADIDRQLSSLNDSNSPEQFDMVIHKTAPALLGGALEGYDSGYEGVMGQPMEEKRLIFPQTKEKLLKMGITNFAGRQLAPEGGGAAGGGAGAAAEQAAITELNRQGKLVNPDTIKQAVKIMQGQ